MFDILIFVHSNILYSHTGLNPAGLNLFNYDDHFQYNSYTVGISLLANIGCEWRHLVIINYLPSHCKIINQ